MKIELLALLAILLLTSCESVQPWERGTLARPEMQLSADQLGDALYDQVYYSKEASSGGTSAAGAGCGCN
jgi:hypothetical protein